MWAEITLLHAPDDDTHAHERNDDCNKNPAEYADE